MSDDIVLFVDGRSVRSVRGVSVAAALLNAGVTAFRTSIGGTARGPVCGMGVCHECRVTIDGVPHQRSCMVAACDGMDVRTHG
jgi:aerobic-type carbon monoxide dehydrogenase small subunit (CoxS/CutS family)